MSNFRGAAVAGFAGLAMIAAAMAGAATATAAEPAALPAAGAQTAVVDHASTTAERGITRPWRYHSTHRTQAQCAFTGQILKAEGIANETQCRLAGLTYRLYYR
ncbi:hypothetical protein [Jiangella endophytica]|uniref:hypothetical protein n=1 Tax=Jiangella endophytica TaxID=1623398 RepID=UPI0013003826|nr:hypothetical protein [Jiangella endophytica]